MFRVPILPAKSCCTHSIKSFFSEIVWRRRRKSTEMLDKCRADSQSAQSETQNSRRELRLRDLVLFNVSAVVSLRWVSAAAHAGAGSLVLWILAALFFFLPSAITVAALSHQFPQEGGLYIWTKY